MKRNIVNNGIDERCSDQFFKLNSDLSVLLSLPELNLLRNAQYQLQEDR